MIRASTNHTGAPPLGPDGPPAPEATPSGPRVLVFSDEYAPVWTDPETGQGGPWTSTRFRAAGFEVLPVPDHSDLYAVNLDSRHRALPGPDGAPTRPTPPDNPHAG